MKLERDDLQVENAILKEMIQENKQKGEQEMLETKQSIIHSVKV